MDPKLQASISELLSVFAAPEQLPGLEVLSASWERGETQKDPNGDAPPKKRKHEAEAYQAQLFTDLQRWLAEDSARFAKLLTPLLEAFVLGLRRQRLQEQNRKEWQRKAEGIDEKAAAGAQRTPKEFLIFDQFWKALKPQLRGSECPRLALQSFGDLWRVVRRHNLYRPREDPCGRQSKALGGSVALLLKRLQTGAPHEDLSWACLEELLALDVAPFESRLPALWAAALRGSAGAPFGAALLRSYAAISDLPACLEALVQALLKEGEDCKADLVDSPTFLEGLEKAASQLSTPQQLRGAWELFLQHLPKDQVPVSWAPRLLGHLSAGLQPTELTLEPLRELFMETFSRVEGFEPPPRWLHSLLLSLCRLGRKISAFDLPPLLQKASPVAAKTLKGLEQLAATALQESEATDEQAEAASVLLAALQDHQHAARKKRRKRSAPEVARSLLQMKAHGGRLQLLAPTLATVLSEEGEDLESLASRLTIQDKVAWRQLGACAFSGTKLPPKLSWCQDGEALLAAPALRAPLLRSLAERLQEALRDDGHEEKKPKKRKQPAPPGRHEMLQGVLTAVYATRAVSLRDLPTDLTVQLMEGHLEALRAAVSAPAALRALALRCFGSLLHRTATLLGSTQPALSEAVAKVVQSGPVLTDLASRLADDEASVASALAAALAEFLRLRPGEAFGAAARRRLAAATAAAVAGDSAVLDEAGQKAVVALPPPAELLQSGGSLPKRLQLFEAFLAEGSRQSSPLDRSIEITIREDAERGDAKSGLEMALALLAEEVSRLTRLGRHAADSASKRRAILVALEQVLPHQGTTLRLRLAASRLLRRLCDAFGQGDDRELWDHTAALLLSWTEYLAGQADVAAVFEDEGLAGGAESFKALAKAPGGSAEDLLQRICFRISSRSAKEGPALATLGSAAAALLSGLPRTPALPDAVIGDAAAAARRLLGSAEEPGAPAEHCTALHVSASKMTRALYVHLASPLMASGRHRRLPHKHLADLEGQLLETAACTARAAVARGFPADSTPAGASAFAVLQVAANSLLKAIFAAVPSEGVRLPAWTERPHLLAEAFRPMLEAVYAAPNGTAAVQAAGDVTRLWEVLSQGGSRSTAASAGRSGHTTFQARVQRATMGFALPLIAHALSCERHFAGVEAAARRVGAARDEEAAKWKEAVSILQEGQSSLLNSVKGAENLLQGLYATLREPLRSMFKELHQSWQKRRYQGEA
ncbi:unnamed protein product [Symbiodinium sp. CCMP2592]|nr:unnamed protein product [Symbiodinium sp. CCMP2592]